MNKFIWVILLISSPLVNLSAQGNMETDTSETETRFLKNEIGISVNPILMVALGASNWDTRWALTYRRHLNEKLSLRAIAAIHFSNQNAFLDNEYERFTLTDSTEYIVSKHRQNYTGFSINSGLQYNWGNKKLKWFTGMDLFYQKTQRIVVTDSLLYESNSGNSPVNNFVGYGELNRDEDIAHHFGIAPFIGIRAMFSKHWGFSTQFGIRISAAKQTSERFAYNAPTPYYSNSFNTFNVNAEALFQDVSLIFRF